MIQAIHHRQSPGATASTDCRPLRAKTVTFSAKVFIPVTRLCRNSCDYCDYALSLSDAPFFTRPEEALAIARSGQSAGCTEALLIGGDKPERRYKSVRSWLTRHGFDSTAHYTYELCRLILNETSLYPHTNVGALSRDEIAELRTVNASLGLMLESASPRLHLACGPHHGSPDKRLPDRLRSLEAIGQAGALLTTGLLIGIGETVQERYDSLVEINRIHEAYGHVQEVIIQNVRPGSLAASRLSKGPRLADVLSAVTLARRVLRPEINIQVPPNLVLLLTGRLDLFLNAGANDWGGVSPVTLDQVNPDSPWPDLGWLRTHTEAAGFSLRQRFPAYPEFVRSKSSLISDPIKRKLSRDADDEGFVRDARFASHFALAGETS